MARIIEQLIVILAIELEVSIFATKLWG